LCKAPVSAISGINETNAASLKDAFAITSVEELAENKYVLLAQAINAFSRGLQVISPWVGRVQIPPPTQLDSFDPSLLFPTPLAIFGEVFYIRTAEVGNPGLTPVMESKFTQ